MNLDKVRPNNKFPSVSPEDINVVPHGRFSDKEFAPTFAHQAEVGGFVDVVQAIIVASGPQDHKYNFHGKFCKGATVRRIAAIMERANFAILFVLRAPRNIRTSCCARSHKEFQ